MLWSLFRREKLIFGQNWPSQISLCKYMKVPMQQLKIYHVGLNPGFSTPRSGDPFHPFLLGRDCSYKGLERSCHIVFWNHLSLQTVVKSKSSIEMYLCTRYLVPNTLYLVPGSKCQIHMNTRCTPTRDLILQQLLCTCSTDYHYLPVILQLSLLKSC